MAFDFYLCTSEPKSHFGHMVHLQQGGSNQEAFLLEPLLKRRLQLDLHFH